MKLNLFLKIKAGALQLTVFIAVLIALLLSGLILYAYTFNYMKEQSKGGIENIQLADSGINYFLNQIPVANDTISINLTTKKNHSLRGNLSSWGIFQKAFVISQFRNKKFKKTALIGSLINSTTSPTLFLEDHQNPLSIVGSTKLVGNIYLPTQGIKTGYIAGQSYFGSQLVYGNKKTSTNTLPKLDDTLLETIASYLEREKLPSPEGYIALHNSKNQSNSFKQISKKIYSKKAIVLENIAITGNIIIKSDTLITVNNTAILKDVILIAPIIEIEDGTTGNFQALANKKIIVGKDCKLNYPSALLVYHDNKLVPSTTIDNKSDNQIYINEGTIIIGSVCYFQTSDKIEFTTQVVLETKAKIKGQIYCNGNFELKGTVSGSAYIRQFIANQSGSIFVNHIYNGVIENETIPTIFGGILFLNKSKTTVQWLY